VNLNYFTAHHILSKNEKENQGVVLHKVIKQPGESKNMFSEASYKYQSVPINKIFPFAD
jgi:hypothetical protein